MYARLAKSFPPSCWCVPVEASFVFQLAEYPHVSESQNLIGQNMQLRDLAT